ncbi:MULTISPECIES: hypothetical protein [Streptomyces]|uniref:hypothetical protein n=1 Tax=Streptomyces TaxID=1883 RepID=UPI0021B3485C|nr:hypothetical protein [Streptomyces sp. CS-7]MCT6781896.1 hypothetical protein [Streptomyces sp. CS-7]
MSDRRANLGSVQVTLLIPLYGRAVETRKKHAILRDAKADEMVAEIDYDFARFDNLPSLIGTVLRTALFDRWVHDFLAESPAGTVIEIGTGLNTRFERSDNGRRAGSTSIYPMSSLCDGGSPPAPQSPRQPRTHRPRWTSS